MATPDGEKRPPLAVAMELASQVTSVAFMMALPAGLGYWADSRLGTSPWLLVVGAALGMTGGMMQLFRGMGRRKDTGGQNRHSERNER